MKRLMLSVIAGMLVLAVAAPEACGQAWRRRPSFQAPRPVVVPQAMHLPRPVLPPAMHVPRPAFAPAALHTPRPAAALGTPGGFAGRRFAGRRFAASSPVVIGPRGSSRSAAVIGPRGAPRVSAGPQGGGPGPDSVVPAGFAPPPVQAVPPASSAAVPSVADTMWAGRETLQGFGALVFVLAADGRATMADAATLGSGGKGRTVTGSWQQNGADVAIRFGDCTYNGRINGDALSGTANFTSGRAGAWSFQVRLQPPQSDAGSGPGPAADPGR